MIMKFFVVTVLGVNARKFLGLDLWYNSFNLIVEFIK